VWFTKNNAGVFEMVQPFGRLRFVDGLRATDIMSSKRAMAVHMSFANGRRMDLAHAFLVYAISHPANGSTQVKLL
jgi:hypothetical protein